jgi:adenylate kinase family enzyme
MVIMISGTPAAGKSSVSQSLAKRFPKSAYLEIDSFKDMIVGGNIAPWDPQGPEQFKLMEKNFLAITKNFLDEGYVVILDYVFNDEQVKHYNELLGDVYGFLLLPSKEVLKKRDLERDPAGEMQERIEVLYQEFANVEHNLLRVVDSSNQTLDETVGEIFKQLKSN